MTLENRLERLEYRINSWNDRLSSLDYNMKHYLEKRMPIAIKHERIKARLNKKILSLEKALGKVAIHTTWKAKGGPDRVIFLCTHNQASKLRRIADSDLRNFNKGRGKSNANS